MSIKEIRRRISVIEEAMQNARQFGATHVIYFRWDDGPLYRLPLSADHPYYDDVMASREEDARAAGLEIVDPDQIDERFATLHFRTPQ